MTRRRPPRPCAGSRTAAPGRPRSTSFGRDLTAEAAAGRIDPVIGRDRRDRADGRDPRPPAQEQRRADRRGRRRQDRDRRGPRPPHRRGRRPGDAARPPRWSRSTSPAWSPAPSSAASSSSASRRRSSRGRRRGRAGSCCSSTSCTRSSAPARAEGAMDAANMLKPMLARGELRMIGATTLAEFRSIERDGALARRFSRGDRGGAVGGGHVDDPARAAPGLRGATTTPRSPTRRWPRPRGSATATSPSTGCRTRPSTWSTRPPRACACARPRGGDAEAPARASSSSCARPSRRAVDAEAYEEAGRAQGRRATRSRRGSAAAERRGRATGERDASASPRWPRSSPPAPASRSGELVAGELERLADLEDDLHGRVIGQEQAVEVVADTIRRARVGLADGDTPAGDVPVPRARPASARPSSSRRSPSGCSRPRSRSCASTCPSSASRTRWRG